MSSKTTSAKRISRIFVLLCLLPAVFLPANSVAQERGKIPRIGYIESSGSPSNPGPSVEAFRQGLRDLGYIEGKTIQVEYRFLEGKRDRIPSVVAELVRLKVDVLIPEAPPAVRAAKQATKTIPIVIVTSEDPSRLDMWIA